MKDKVVLGHSVQRDLLLPNKNAKLCDIRHNSLKPHRLLLVYQEVAVAVYSINKHEMLR